ncbi:MAG: hypothetical protein J7M26_10575, partial [Armatimonadetes bacterium]|nr:hypothetical protein [Armatimonadota bacterium]
LEAAVWVKATPRYAEVLESFGAEELRRLLIVSQVEVEEVAEAGGEEPFAAEAREAEGEKCQRCWVKSTTVGEDEEYKDLCARCADRVRRWPGVAGQQA